MATQKYFNFPVDFLPGLLNSTRKTGSDIISYAVYRQSIFNDWEDSGFDAFKKAASYLNTSFSNIKTGYPDAKRIYGQYPDPDDVKLPMTGISTDKLWEFIKEDKSD